jgi:hypothetical protein
LAVSACSAAHSATPDSSNPAHCIAAFNYGAYWLKVARDDRGVRHMYIRGAFEMEKWKAGGHSAEEALVEGKAITERYVRDRDAMMRLLERCGEAQDVDPKFHESQDEIASALHAKGAF